MTFDDGFLMLCEYIDGVGSRFVVHIVGIDYESSNEIILWKGSRA